MPKPHGEGWLEKLKGRLAPVFAPVVTPRFAMSFGMAFFSDHHATGHCRLPLR